MPEAVEIVSQSEQQSLAALRKQAAAGSAARQFAFGHGEDRLDQGAATVLFSRKVGAHLSTNAVNGPRLFPTFGGDDAPSMQLLANKGVIAFRVELRIG